MTNQSVKKELNNHGLRLWQLCKQLGISRSSYYTYYCHRDFKGKKAKVRNAIRELIKGDPKDAD